jgi:hypothetical protein
VGETRPVLGRHCDSRSAALRRTHAVRGRSLHHGGDAALELLAGTAGVPGVGTAALYRAAQVSRHGYQVTVVSLEPEPHAGRAIPPAQYRATLSVLAL